MWVGVGGGAGHHGAGVGQGIMGQWVGWCVWGEGYLISAEGEMRELMRVWAGIPVLKEGCGGHACVCALCRHTFMVLKEGCVASCL